MGKDDIKRCRLCQFFINGVCTHFTRDRGHGGDCPHFIRRPSHLAFFVKF